MEHVTIMYISRKDPQGGTDEYYYNRYALDTGMPKKPQHIAAEMHSQKEPPSIFRRIKEKSGAPQDSTVIFGELNIKAIHEAGLGGMLWKMIDFSDREYRWCAFGPCHLRAALDKYDNEGGFADLSLAEYLQKIYSTEQ